MIGNILGYVAKELNWFICRNQGLSMDSENVVLSTIVNPDGSMATQEENVVFLTLADLREDAVAYSLKPAQYSMGGPTATEIDLSPLHLNLFLLFSAYFPGNRTRDALNALTYVLRFFQGKSAFNRENSPGMPNGVEKLEFHMVTQEFHEKGHMWGLLGSKMLPSVLYKVRMLTLEEEEPVVFPSYIKEVDINSQP